MLQINNVSKRFDSFPVLKSLSWTVDPQRIVGLIGSNGAGKSTLMRCIAGIYDFDGNISFNAQPIDTQRGHIFFVSDDPFYISRFNTEEMHDFYRCFYASFSEEAYRRLLNEFRFDNRKPIHKLSKGLRRQYALIMALSCQPKLLMLDESFDGLDPVMRLTFKRELIRLVADTDCSVIISSHNIRELEDISDNMALLEDGVVKFTNSVDDLNDTYHKVQVAYEVVPNADYFDTLDLLSYEINNRVVTMIYKGDTIPDRIKSSHPIFINDLPISMEEIFVVEMEAK